MRTLIPAILGVGLLLFAQSATAQDRETVRQWIRDQKTEHPIHQYPVGTNCCDEADGKQRSVEELGGGQFKTYDDSGTPLYFDGAALGVKGDSPFFQWFVYIYGGNVICARRTQTGG